MTEPTTASTEGAPIHVPGADISIPAELPNELDAFTSTDPLEFQPDEDSEIDPLAAHEAEFVSDDERDHQETGPDGDARTYDPESGAKIEPDYWTEEVPVLETQGPKRRPAFILSEVDVDHPHGGIVIGWDTCGKCRFHIRECDCPDGPHRPAYVDRWRKGQENYDRTQAAKKAVAPVEAVVEADPDVVEATVEEAIQTYDNDYVENLSIKDLRTLAVSLSLDEQKKKPGIIQEMREKGLLAPKVRKRRTKAEIEAAANAAGDLAEAMTKE